MLTNPSENLDGFVILLTQSPTLNNFNICYLEKDFQLEYQDNRICFFDIKNLESVYQKIKRDLRFCDKRVLLYLGKFPAFGFDVDGGSILAKQLIDTFKWRCKLDVSFIRKNNEEYSDEVCTSIKYFKYIDAFNNKFVRRVDTFIDPDSVDLNSTISAYNVLEGKIDGDLVQLNKLLQSLGLPEFGETKKDETNN